MKNFIIKYFTKEYFLTLSLSILLWVVSLFFIYFFAETFPSVEESYRVADNHRVSRHYEESADVVR